MSTTIPVVRQKLADIISAATGLRASAYVGDMPITPPCVRVARGPVNPDWLYGSDVCEYPFVVSVYAGRAADRASEKLLDTYVEMTTGTSTSIRYAVETMSNWSSIPAVQNVTLAGVSETKVVEISGVPYLLVDFDVVVTF